MYTKTNCSAVIIQVHNGLSLYFEKLLRNKFKKIKHPWNENFVIQPKYTLNSMLMIQLFIINCLLLILSINFAVSSTGK